MRRDCLKSQSLLKKVILPNEIPPSEAEASYNKIRETATLNFDTIVKRFSPLHVFVRTLRRVNRDSIPRIKDVAFNKRLKDVADQDPPWHHVFSPP